MATAQKNLSEFNSSDLPDASGLKIGLVVSQWNSEITHGLAQGAIETLTRSGVPQNQILQWAVPGSFELVYGCQKMMSTAQYLDAIIAIGSVVEGETKHFDFVCSGVTQGIKDLNLMGIIPVIFCVLTDHNMEQARARSGGKHGNKGVEAAVAAIQMAVLGAKK
jgi:6,7-dimethyl-8-ribityllumazine synthase